MDSEKELLLFNIKGKFVKNFDTFSAMDPFLKATIGKSSNRTETIKKGGKDVSWQTAITVNYVSEAELKLEAFDEDLTENESIGSALIKVSTLKVGNNKLQVDVFLDKDKTGTISFEYTLKDMKTNPTIIFSNISCSFVKKTELFIKCSPFFSVTAGSKSDKTQVIKGSEKELKWNDKLRLTFDTPQKQVRIEVLDSDNKDKPLFTHLSKIQEFDQLKSHKSINITDPSFEYLGTLDFDYETANLVTDKQSADNAKAQVENEKYLTSIILSSIKAQFLKDGFDPYLKIVLGSNVVKTSVVKKAKKDVQFEDTIKLYAEAKQTKINVVAMDKKMVGKDDIIGVGSIFLSDLKPTTTIPLLNREGDSKGAITLATSSTKALGKTLKISEIKADYKQDADTFAKMDPFTQVSIGGFIDRTETIDNGGKNVVFKRPITLKFVDQDKIVFKSYDEDATENEFIGQGEIKISELTSEKGQKSVNLTNQKKEYVGILTVTYESTNVVKPKLQSEVKDVPKEVSKDNLKSSAPDQPKDQPKEQLKDQQKNPAQSQVKDQPMKEEPKQQSKDDSPMKKSSVADNKKTDPKNQQKQDSPKKQENFSTIKNNSQIPQKKSEKQIPIQNEQAEGDRQKNKSIKPKEALEKPGVNSQESLNDPSGRQGSLPNVSKRLPPVVEKKNFGDKIFQQQSAMTLQKSILSYSVPKAARFHETAKPIGAQPTYYVESCFKSDKSKGAGFGYGTRRPYPDWMQRNMKENPAPGAYESLGQADNKKGRTFGISYKYYEKVMIPKEDKQARKINPNQRLSPLKMKEQRQN